MHILFIRDNQLHWPVMNNTAQVHPLPQGAPSNSLRAQEGEAQLVNSEKQINGLMESTAMSGEISSSPLTDLDNIENNLMRAEEQAKAEPHKYLYSGAVLFVLGFYFIYILLCKWRKDRKNKKPIKNELVEEKVENDQTPESSKPSKALEMVELS